MDRLPNIRKIAVLKATALGDYISATPALQALRETYPTAEIVYLGRPLHKAIIESRPTPVDRAVVIPVSGGVRHEPLQPDLKEDPAELDAFFARMQNENFDLAIQMHGGGRNTNPFIKRLGAKFSVGMRTPDAITLDRWMPYLVYQNEFARLLELVQLVGAKPCLYPPTFAVTEADFAELGEKLPQVETPFVVLHPGASDVRRRWPPERFAAVGDALAERGLHVIVTGVGYEREVVEAVIAAMIQPAVNACDVLSIGGLAALLKSAALLVSNDTGPLHVANAVGTPNVGIFWCGNYMNWSHFGRRRHRPLRSWMVTCPLCGTDMTQLDPPRDRCEHETCFVAGVTIDEVLTSAHELLDYAAHFGSRMNGTTHTTRIYQQS